MKACPFCGKQPRSGWISGSDVTGDEYCGYWDISCCVVDIAAESENEAVAQWESRFLEAETIEVLDCLAGLAQDNITTLRNVNEGRIASLEREARMTGECTYSTEERSRFEENMRPTRDLIRRANDISDRLEGRKT